LDFSVFFGKHMFAAYKLTHIVLPAALVKSMHVLFNFILISTKHQEDLVFPSPRTSTQSCLPNFKMRSGSTSSIADISMF
jgi:hypothetical protein